MAGMHNKVRTISVGLGAHSSASPSSLFTHRSLAVAIVQYFCVHSVFPLGFFLAVGAGLSEHPPPPTKVFFTYETELSAILSG